MNTVDVLRAPSGQQVKRSGAERRGHFCVTLATSSTPTGKRSMAKPNYAFAKRQRDLAKKQKKEEKKQRKQESASEHPSAGDMPDSAD
jgi:hypothetical protein